MRPATLLGQGLAEERKEDEDQLDFAWAEAVRGSGLGCYSALRKTRNQGSAFPVKQVYKKQEAFNQYRAAICLPLHWWQA